MNFDWSQEQIDQRDRVAQALDDHARADIESLEHAAVEHIHTTTRVLLGRMAGAGYFAGLGGDPMDRLAAQEELARASGSLFLASEYSATLFGGLVQAWDSPSAEPLLAALRRGETVGAVAASNGPGEAACAATVQDDSLVVTGHKPFVTNGPIADWFAVVVTLDEEPQGRHAVCMLERGTPGLLASARIETLGHRGLAVGELTLDQIRVPLSKVVGPFDGPGPLARLRVAEDLLLAVASVGLAQRCLAAARAHARHHQRDGKPILRRQQVAFALAEMLTQVETAQWLLRRAAWLVSVRDPEAGTVLSCAKVFGAEAAERVARSGLQILAGQGYMSGSTLERAHREACLAAISGTTSERARMGIAADLIARSPVA